MVTSLKWIVNLAKLVSIIITLVKVNANFAPLVNSKMNLDPFNAKCVLLDKQHYMKAKDLNKIASVSIITSKTPPALALDALRTISALLVAIALNVLLMPLSPEPLAALAKDAFARKAMNGIHKQGLASKKSPQAMVSAILKMH